MSKLLDNDISFINSIFDSSHQWAWDLYLTSNQNHWTPSEVSMSEDIKQWKDKECFSDDERLVVKRCLGFFAGGESVVSNNLLVNMFGFINDPLCRQYILRQSLEEAIHNHTISHICSSLSLDISEVALAYKNIPSIKAKDDFLLSILKDTRNREVTKEEIVRNLFTLYIICEGIFFYSGFAMLLSFERQGKLKGIGKQIDYVLRDECVDGETELLTPTGWKNVKELNIEDKVAQWHEDGTITFCHPIKLSKTIVDNVYTFTSEQGHVNMVVSENHRMVKNNFSCKNRERHLVIEAASDIKFHPYTEHIMCGELNNVGRDKLTPQEQFLIAFQADGSFQKGEYRNGNLCGYITVIFQFKKQRKKDRLDKILKECNFNYKKYNTNKKGFDTYAVQVPPSFPLKTLEWIDLSDKTIEWCKEFIEEIAVWDGHNVKESKGSRITYGSVIKVNSDIVQAVAALCGYRTHCTIRPDNRKETFSDYHRIQICKNRKVVLGGTIQKENISYNDYVYGVQVPSGIMLIRRKGAVAVTGNSNHVKFGNTLLNIIKLEYPEIFTDKLEEELTSHLKTATSLEVAYAKDLLPRGIMGLNWEMFIDYTQYIANRRLANLGFKFRYPTTITPFPWLSTKMDLDKITNFFEGRVTEYKIGGLIDDLD